MSAPAMGIAAKTYWSEMPIEGERWVAISGTSAWPCQTMMAANTPTIAQTAWRTTSRACAGSRVTRLSTPRCAVRRIATQAPRNDAQTKKYRQSSSLQAGVSFST